MRPAPLCPIRPLLNSLPLTTDKKLVEMGPESKWKPAVLRTPPRNGVLDIPWYGCAYGSLLSVSVPEHPPKISSESTTGFSQALDCLRTKSKCWHVERHLKVHSEEMEKESGNSLIVLHPPLNPQSCNNTLLCTLISSFTRLLLSSHSRIFPFPSLPAPPSSGQRASHSAGRPRPQPLLALQAWRKASQGQVLGAGWCEW